MIELRDYTEDIDFSELKSDVGRPSEEAIKRIDLKPYLVESEFQRRFDRFYSNWETIIEAKAQSRNKAKYIGYMEEFYGEVIEKFSLLGKGGKRIVLSSENPIAALYRLTNLSRPKVFHKKEDNTYFITEMLKTPLN